MTQVVVIGGSGMLGTMLVDVLSRNAALNVAASFSKPWLNRPPTPGVKWFMFKAGSPSHPIPTSIEIGPGDWIVNAAGVIRHRLGRRPTLHLRQQAIDVNSKLPYWLAARCEQAGARLINVATDCVFSGEAGGYVEGSRHDPVDFYGLSKSLGEVRGNKGVLNIRCSIVGPEARGKLSLLEWFLSNKPGTTIRGWANHAWNGVTTLALAKVVEGLILYEDGEFPVDLQHLVPAHDVSKAALLDLFRESYNHPVNVDHVQAAGGAVDRTLATASPDYNNRLWSLAGFEDPPTMEEMLSQLSQHNYLFSQAEVTP